MSLIMRDMKCVDMNERTEGNQLNCHRYIFVDAEHSVYVSEMENHCVTKWTIERIIEFNVFKWKTVDTRDRDVGLARSNAEE